MIPVYRPLIRLLSPINFMIANQNVYTAVIKGDNNVSIIDWNFTKNVLYLFVSTNTSLNNTKIPELITAKSFHKCQKNKQFISRVYMFINHKMTHGYIYFRFARHALQLHHVTD